MPPEYTVELDAVKVRIFLYVHMGKIVFVLVYNLLVRYLSLSLTFFRLAFLGHVFMYKTFKAYMLNSQQQDCSGSDPFAELKRMHDAAVTVRVITKVK